MFDSEKVVVSSLKADCCKGLSDLKQKVIETISVDALRVILPPTVPLKKAQPAVLQFFDPERLQAFPLLLQFFFRAWARTSSALYSPSAATSGPGFFQKNYFLTSPTLFYL